MVSRSYIHPFDIALIRDGTGGESSSLGWLISRYSPAWDERAGEVRVPRNVCVLRRHPDSGEDARCNADV